MAHEDPDTAVLPREEVIPLIISQLSEYGYANLASVIAEHTNTPSSLSPSARLAELCYMGVKSEEEGEDMEIGRRDSDDEDEHEENGVTRAGTYLNLDADTKPDNKPPPNFQTWYITTHKAGCQTAVFSPDGKYVATGSADTSLKVLDVSKMNTRSDSGEDRPVIRTLYDHVAPVNDLAFHPNGLVLASCSDDQSIKLYDLSKPNVKRAFRYLQDSHAVRSIAFHPAGDFICAGTDHEAMRIYDVKTFQCYIPAKNPTDLHKGGITQVRFASNGSLVVTSSLDGSIKLWDLVSGKCVRTIEGAHSGAAVSSSRFSKNGKYILSGGQDSVARLWDVGSGKLIHGFEGAAHKSNILQTTFTSNEDYVMSSDEVNNTVVCWDSRTGALLKRWSGHTNTIRCIATSPTEQCFVSCSDDHRARYWHIE
ncbi:hypothetical protein K7432_009212 [Basidiobolus ranarum]|uniref:Cleavage stimulation factor 50 kDa subunit n=1 Tax=Basidiobolus ranarum TaxID=34480 RepID=A0ABR2VXT3_9FUNG